VESGSVFPVALQVFHRGLERYNGKIELLNIEEGESRGKTPVCRRDLPPTQHDTPPAVEDLAIQVDITGAEFVAAPKGNLPGQVKNVLVHNTFFVRGGTIDPSLPVSLRAPQVHPDGEGH
jgi:hypothetical protein